MPQYAGRITGYFTIDAENIAQAHKLAKRCLKITGSRVGRGRPSPKDREMVRYEIVCADPEIFLTRAKEDNAV